MILQPGRAGEHPMHNSTSQSGSSPRPASSRLLVIEDEQIVALDLQQGLGKLGYQVLATVDNARDALILTHDLRPDLVLMDVKINGPMDGIEAGQHIAKIGIPVIYLTAYSDSDTVRRAAESMPYGFLTKPYQLHEVAASIEVALYKAAMERQLRQGREKLISEQDDLLALLTHEIRTPLATINAAAESLRILDAAACSPERDRRYERITEAIRRADYLVQLASRRDLGSDPRGPVLDVDLITLTRDLLDQLSARQQTQVQLQTHQSQLRVRAYPELLQFALCNLLDNAFKFSPAGSPVRIEIVRHERRPAVHWTISDAGPGVATAEQELIFDKYYRHGSTAVPGLGLGLYLTRQLLRSVGGEVRCVDVADGARFDVTLPLPAS